MSLLPELQFNILDFFSITDLIELHFNSDSKSEYSSLLNNNNYLAQRLYKEIKYLPKDFQRTYLYHGGKMSPLDIFIKQLTINSRVTFGSERFYPDLKILFLRSLREKDLKLVKYFYRLVQNIYDQVNELIRDGSYQKLNFILTPQIFVYLLSENQDEIEPNTIEIYTNLLLNFSEQERSEIRKKIFSFPIFIKHIEKLI